MVIIEQNERRFRGGDPVWIGTLISTAKLRAEKRAKTREPKLSVRDWLAQTAQGQYTVSQEQPNGVQRAALFEYEKFLKRNEEKIGYCRSENPDDKGSFLEECGKEMQSLIEGFEATDVAPMEVFIKTVEVFEVNRRTGQGLQRKEAVKLAVSYCSYFFDCWEGHVTKGTAYS